MTGDTWQVVVGLATIGVAVYGIVRYPGVLYRSVQQMRGGWHVAALLPLTSTRSLPGRYRQRC